MLDARHEEALSKHMIQSRPRRDPFDSFDPEALETVLDVWNNNHAPALTPEAIRGMVATNRAEIIGACLFIGSSSPFLSRLATNHPKRLFGCIILGECSVDATSSAQVSVLRNAELTEGTTATASTIDDASIRDGYICDSAVESSDVSHAIIRDSQVALCQLEWLMLSESTAVAAQFSGPTDRPILMARIGMVGHDNRPLPVDLTRQ